jgi:hypothetical protein
MIGKGKRSAAVKKAIQEEFGTKVVSITCADLHAAFLKADPAGAAKWADAWMKGAEKMLEATRDDVVKAGAMYLAMQEVMKQHNARAITINCLGGFYSGQLQAFPCLGFVEFNNQGLVGGCEGDLSSAITMLAVGGLTGRPGYISDPVIDTARNQIIYAHCVAPTRVFGPQGPGFERDFGTEGLGPADVDVSLKVIEVDEVPEGIAEVRHPEADPVADNVLLDSCVPAGHALGAKIDVSDRAPGRRGGEELVE